MRENLVSAVAAVPFRQVTWRKKKMNIRSKQSMLGSACLVERCPMSMGLGKPPFQISVDLPTRSLHELIAALSAFFIEPFVDFLRKVFCLDPHRQAFGEYPFVKVGLRANFPRCPACRLGRLDVFRENRL